MDEFVKKELQLINLHDTELGNAMSTFIKEICRVTRSSVPLMRHILENVRNLIDKKPISAITENDFVYDEHTDCEVCTRYPYIIKERDGKYYNNRAISFKNSHESHEEMFIYQGTRCSRQEITMPYVLKDEVVIMKN